jgi:1-acyl-sn-glycerol-3-phosphate acyltransferase
MLVYPEGTSTDGRSGILPFKSTAFDAAESTGCQVIEVLLFFSCPDDPGKSSAWFGDTPFGAYLWHALGLKKVEARVYIIGVTSIADGEDRKSLARRVHGEMSEAYWRIMHDEEL